MLVTSSASHASMFLTPEAALTPRAELAPPAPAAAPPSAPAPASAPAARSMVPPPPDPTQAGFAEVVQESMRGAVSPDPHGPGPQCACRVCILV
jgi:hypothetical protein